MIMVKDEFVGAVCSRACSPWSSPCCPPWRRLSPVRNSRDACRCGRRARHLTETLNEDPYNMRAEELALEECMRGVDVRRTWTERQMVVTFGGMMMPGTPDGMFEDWNNDLTCVQVVRVPITPSMDMHEVNEVLYQTVLTKVIKSQAWLIATKNHPRYFIIFCWLPHLPGGYAEVSGERTQALLERLRNDGWPFYVRAMVADRRDDLFPAKFAFNQTCQEGHDANSQQGHRAFRARQKRKSISEADLSTVDPTSFGDDDDEDIIWDIFDEDGEVQATTMNQEHEEADVSELEHVEELAGMSVSERHGDG